jgi:hypothetical protein
LGEVDMYVVVAALAESLERLDVDAEAVLLLPSFTHAVFNR